jgi:hypothetical protein
MKTGHDALGNVKKESGSAKHKNGTRRPRYHQNTDLALTQFSLYMDCTVSVLRVCSEGLI